MSCARLLLMLSTAVATLQPASASPGAEARAPEGRGMWVWQSVPARPMVDFARSHGVDRLWLATTTRLGAAERLRLTATMRLARRHGIGVAALGGAPVWALRHDEAMAWARRSTEVVGALHVDVEPYCLRAWETDQDRVVRGYLELLDNLRALPVRLEVDVPFWYGSIAAPGGKLADAVLARVDAVTVMSYRDHALGENGILDISRDWMRRTTQAHVPLTLGAETNPVPACPHCTFAQEGAGALDREQAVVARQLRNFPSFAGVAVHDWAGWRALERDGRR